MLQRESMSLHRCNAGARLTFGLWILLLASAQMTPAQMIRNRSYPTGDWRADAALHTAIWVFRSVRKPAQQKDPTPPPPASSDLPAAQTGASKSAREALAATRSEAPDDSKTSADETPRLPSRAPLAFTPAQLLATSRTVFVRSRSAWVRRKSIEDALMKKKGFLELGYAVVKDETEADLLLEVDHTALTMRYPFTVTHTKSQIVVASGTVISLRLLNDVPGDTAGSFVKQAREARAQFATPSATRPNK